MGVSENVVYPIVPNGFADHYPYEKWLAIIGNINPTFSDKPISPSLSFLVICGQAGGTCLRSPRTVRVVALWTAHDLVSVVVRKRPCHWDDL